MPDGSTTPTLTPAQLTEKYIQLRDKIHEIEEVQKKYLKPYKEAKALLEGLLLAELSRAGTDAMRAPAGTVYKAIATSVTVKDWPATRQYIVDNAFWDLLQARVSKEETLSLLERTGEPIPGVDVSQIATLHVRRA